MGKYLFVESEGDDYFRSDFIENTTAEQRREMWKYTFDSKESDESLKKLTNLLKSIPSLKDRDFTLAAHILDDDTMDVIYDRDLFDYDTEKARGFIEVD